MSENKRKNRKVEYKNYKKRKKLKEIDDEFAEFFDDSKKESAVDESDENIVSDVTISDTDSIKDKNSNSSSSSNFVSDQSEHSVSDLEHDDSLEKLLQCEGESECQEINQLKEWMVTNNVSQTVSDGLLKILKPRLLPQLPKSTKTLLKCDINFEILDMVACDGTVGEFFYFGIENQLQKIVNTDLHKTDVLEFVFNSDGFSPFRSSPKTVIPILGKIYTKNDVYEPFSIAVYSGSAKPKNPSDYLKDFVIELNRLLQNGIKINGRLFQFKIKCFICDTPARAFLKSVLGHTGIFACERCIVKGQKEDGVMVFLDTDAILKTDEDFRNYKYPNHHTGVSLLTTINPPIGMITQFILDPMHLLFLGVMKRILEYLLAVSLNKARLSAELKCRLHKLTADISSDIPIEFPRKMRSTVLHAKFKAVEFKFFLLYAAPIICKDILTDDMYRHLMLFVVACRFMFSNNWKLKTIRAREFNKKFVDQAKTHYGSTFLTINVHNLYHTVDDAESTDCLLNEISAFVFESYLGKISSRLRSPNNIVSQYCKRQWEIEKYGRKVPKETQNLLILKEVKIQVPRSSNTKSRTFQTEVKKIKYKNFTYTTNHPDNTVLLVNGTIAIIKKFIKKDGLINLVVQKYASKEPVFIKPCDSSDAGIWEVKKLSKNTSTIPLTNIERKCVRLHLTFSEIDGPRMFIVEMLH